MAVIFFLLENRLWQITTKHPNHQKIHPPEMSSHNLRIVTIYAFS